MWLCQRTRPSVPREESSARIMVHFCHVFEAYPNRVSHVSTSSRKIASRIRGASSPFLPPIKQYSFCFIQRVRPRQCSKFEMIQLGPFFNWFPCFAPRDRPFLICPSELEGRSRNRGIEATTPSHCLKRRPCHGHGPAVRWSRSVGSWRSHGARSQVGYAGWSIQTLAYVPTFSLLVFCSVHFFRSILIVAVTRSTVFPSYIRSSHSLYKLYFLYSISSLLSFLSCPTSTIISRQICNYLSLIQSFWRLLCVW